MPDTKQRAKEMSKLSPDFDPIYYEMADQVAYVVAVLPMHRSPEWIEKKLKDRS
jgi:hypothetical protein